MAHVFKKRFSKPLPEGAELFTRRGERFARWSDGAKTRVAQVTEGAGGSLRIVLTSRVFVARYRDSQGVVREVSTGCRDESAARAVLADLERRVELVRSGVLSAAEDVASAHGGAPLDEHIAAFRLSLEAKGCGASHLRDRSRYLKKLAKACGFARLGEINRAALERWIAGEKKAGRSARSINAFRASLCGFCRWAVATGRLTSNPVEGIPRLNEDADRRRIRRALSEEELARLLDAAQRRPLLEAEKAPRPEFSAPRSAEDDRRRLELLGRERALAYKTMALTGLRLGELASLKVGSLRLEAEVPHAILVAASAKNRKAALIPLRQDLVADLEGVLADRLREAQRIARRRGEAVPARLASSESLFGERPSLAAFGRDLAAAGIPKKDEEGRTVDLHALRHTFATLLAKSGVPLRTAQEALRHSNPRLTANVYQHLDIVDVAGALRGLPGLSLAPKPEARAAAVGAESGALGKGDGPNVDRDHAPGPRAFPGNASPKLPLQLPPDPGNSAQRGSLPGNREAGSPGTRTAAADSATPCLADGSEEGSGLCAAGVGAEGASGVSSATLPTWQRGPWAFPGSLSVWQRVEALSRAPDPRSKRLNFFRLSGTCHGRNRWHLVCAEARPVLAASCVCLLPTRLPLLLLVERRDPLHAQATQTALF